MTLQGLFCDSVEIKSLQTVNVSGRIERVWRTICVSPCRITQPAASSVFVVDSDIAKRADATVFLPESVSESIKGVVLPLRFVVVDGAYEGTYESTQPHRVYSNTTNANHIEIDVVRVSA